MTAHEQPDEETELANAAYVWRKSVQESLLSAMRDPSVTMELAEYWFTRWRRAKKRELDWEKIAKDGQV